MSRKKNYLASVSSAHGGRPRLEDLERRTKRIGVPVNEEEDKIISGRAKLTHMKKGVFLRHLGLSKHIQRPVPAINYRAYRQLGRLAADFSYALILIEVGKSIGVDQQLVAQILEEIRRTQNQLMKGK
ncbi:MAG TPA: hypothetical protein VGC66_12080 [Pyrinomonadaceae bacterium]|jgi:hypothetical protein